MKTNAARLLDRLSIQYDTREYIVDPEDLTATNVARKIGMPPEQVFKTLLCRLSGSKPDGEYVFAVVPGDSELDLKKLAVAAEAKKAELASLKDVEPLTGYIRGGVTVMGAKKSYRAFVDEAVELVRHDQRLGRDARPAIDPCSRRLHPRRRSHGRRPHEGEPADGGSGDAAMIYARTVWLHLKKDLQLEWRSREAVAGMLFFTLLIAVVFAMAFDPTGYPGTRPADERRPAVGRPAVRRHHVAQH